MKYEVDYSLYLVTDRTLMSTETLEEAVEQAIRGGCRIVQLREKAVSSFEFYQLALSIREITKKHQVPLIINDRVDLALATDAEGVHLGQSDLPPSIVRSLIGKDKILGVSVSTVDEAVRAEADGADYLGVGAMFATSTKTDTRNVTMEVLSRIREAVQIPIVVIGGINRQTASCFKGSRIDGFAVVSDLIAQKDIAAAAKELRGMFDEISSGE